MGRLPESLWDGDVKDCTLEGGKLSDLARGLRHEEDTAVLGMGEELQRWCDSVQTMEGGVNPQSDQEEVPD